MDDYSFIKKAQDDNEHQSLINREDNPSAGGEECLKEMKEISQLI
jgi:hypothetical protein